MFWPVRASSASKCEFSCSFRPIDFRTRFGITFILILSPFWPSKRACKTRTPKKRPKGPQKASKMDPFWTPNRPLGRFGSLLGCSGALWGLCGPALGSFGGRFGGFLPLSLFFGNAQDAFFLSRFFFARCFSPLAAAAAVRRRRGRRRRPPRRLAAGRKVSRVVSKVSELPHANRK